MFDQVFVAEAPRGKRFWATCAGVTGQVGLVAAMILAPMVWPEALPRPTAFLTLLLPPVPLPPPPRGIDAPQTMKAPTTHAFVDPSGKFVQPTNTPVKIDMTADDPPMATGPFIPGAIPSGAGNGIRDGILGAIALVGANALAPPRPPEPVRTAEPVAAAPDPIRIKLGGVVQEGKLISRVEPQYPSLARQMRVQGVVELMAVVGIDGRIKELKLVSGSPLLSPTAIDAVKRWLYRPTYLNGSPVEVIAPITVTFRLN